MEKDDIELIQNILSGDKGAFSDLFRKYEKRIHAFVWRKIGDFHIAEEITQDTFLQAHKKLASLKNPSQFIGWLYVIADRRCKAWFRKKRMAIQSLETVSEEALEKTAYANYIAEQREEASAEFRREIVDRLLEMLPESERTVVILHYLGEMSCEAIGKFLNVSQNTVKSRLQRGRNRLRVSVDIKTFPDLLHQIRGSTISDRNKNLGLAKGTKTMENNITQDSMQWNLPEDAKARLGKGSIVDIQYSPDGKFLAAASGIGIWLYDVTVYQEVSLLTEHVKTVNSLAFSADGRTLTSGSADAVILWDRSTGVQTRHIGHTHWISSLAFSPDGKMLASDSRDGTIRLWDVITGKQNYTLNKDSDCATMLSFTPDGRTLVSVSWDEKISLWNSITGKHKATFAMHPDCSVTGAAFSPEGKTVAIGSDDGAIYLHDLNTGELKMKLIGHGEHVDNLAFSHDGNTIATSSHYDETIRLWNVNTGEHQLTLNEHSRYVRGLAFSPNGKMLASGSGDGTIRFWDARTGNQKHKFTGHSEYIYSVAFNPNGNIIASGSTNGIINLWDADTRQHIKTLNGSKNRFIEPADSIVFSPDGKILVCGHDGIKLWDVNTGEHKKTLTGHTDTVQSITISPNGETLASGSWDTTIKLWDMYTGKQKKHSKDIPKASAVSRSIRMERPLQVEVTMVLSVFGMLSVVKT